MRGSGSVLELREEIPEAFDTFAWMMPESQDVDERFEDALGKSHPLFTVAAAFGQWLETRDEEAATARLDRIIDKWSLDEWGTRAEYGFAYKVGQEDLPPGWYSGMSDWVLPLFLIGVWQESGREDYKEIADRLVAQASRPISDGGTLWLDGDSCWISEYAWEGMSLEQESFVMNGHQFALTAMGVIAATTGDDQLKDLFSRCSRGIFDRSPKYRERANWPLYMLNPQSIDTRSYSIFEILTFDGLAALSDDQRFRDEADWRRQAFRATHPVNAVTSPTSGRDELVLSLVAPPHPYDFDMYAVSVECTDGTSTRRFRTTKPRDVSLLPKERGLARGSLGDLDPAKAMCDVMSTRGDVKIPLFRTEVTDARTVAAAAPAPHSVTTLNTEATESGAVRIDPPAADAGTDYTALQSRITYSAKAPLSVSEGSVLGVTLGSGGERPTSLIVTSGKRTCQRYYPPVREHPRNALLFSPMGITGCEDLTTVDSVTVVFYRSGLEAPFEVEPGELFAFDSPAQLVNWIDATNPFLPYQ